ncbi:endonuclease VII domain-containing protein [Microbacterium sp. NPDC058269]|uniref:endonuclease VII domain-containing protein n=1 Tax=Microbacterium sp. NPDC058269 TaxID=3346414 RepID=UPI0036D9F5A7
MLRKNYGITHEEYDRMLDEQDGRCGGCGKTTDENDGRLFAVDHDHATGSVRGLLCSPCNLALGNARDSATTLRSLIAYLERHLQSASAALRIGAQNHDH